MPTSSAWQKDKRSKGNDFGEKNGAKQAYFYTKIISRANYDIQHQIWGEYFLALFMDLILTDLQKQESNF